MNYNIAFMMSYWVDFKTWLEKKTGGKIHNSSIEHHKKLAEVGISLEENGFYFKNYSSERSYCDFQYNIYDHDKKHKQKVIETAYFQKTMCFEGEI